MRRRRLMLKEPRLQTGLEARTGGRDGFVLGPHRSLTEPSKAFFQGMPQLGLPSLLLDKGPPTMADAERLGKIASIGQDLISTQLAMASQTPSQALEGSWVLGYCFGVFDALGQRAGLDDGAEGFGLITIGFLGLFADPTDPEAATFVRRSLDSQDNPRFQEGAAAGGSDVFAWAADRAKVPNALFEHLTR